MNVWHTTVLKNCISVIETGKREKGGAVNVGIPSIGAEHLQKDGHINWAKNSMKYVSAVFFETMKTGKLQPDDVLLVKDGATTGKVAYVDTVPTQGAAINEHIFLMRPTEDLLPKYLYFYLYSPIGKNNVLRFFKGAAIGGISRDFLNAEIKMPPISMQKDIVEKLSYIDESIDVCHALLDKAAELVKSRFIEMFGDPVTNPMGWEKINLGSLSLTANNGMARRGNDADGNIVLRLVELQSGKIDYSNPNRISLTDKEKQRYLLQDKDFLFARVNGNPENVGRCAVFHETVEPIYHNDHIIRYHFDEGRIDGTFLSVILNSPYGKSQFKPQLKTSAGQYTVSQSGIDIVEIPLPPIALQNQFADFVALTDKSKLVAQKLLGKLELLRGKMMQEYFG